MDWKQQIVRMISDYIASYRTETQTPMSWQPPLVGFAEAASPEFMQLRQLVHREHALPQDILPGATTVVSYFLPYPPAIEESNRTDGTIASSKWAMAYRETNLLFAALNSWLCGELQKNGISAAPPLALASMDGRTVTSRWSQRHVAKIAGLGDFGLNNMLITEKGCCGRFSSLVTTLKVPADTPKPGACLSRRQDGSCGLCLSRCPSGALTAEGFDRFLCAKICESNQSLHDPEMKFGTDSEVCGKCLTNLPCTFQRP